MLSRWVAVHRGSGSEVSAPSHPGIVYGPSMGRRSNRASAQEREAAEERESLESEPSERGPNDVVYVIVTTMWMGTLFLFPGLFAGAYLHCVREVGWPATLGVAASIEAVVGIWVWKGMPGL